MGIQYIVILKPGLYQSDRLKIKSVKKNKEEELTMAGLWSFLRSKLRHKPKKETIQFESNSSI